jgi:putative spermidine/putrescine transport system substrate-binding protein
MNSRSMLGTGALAGLAVVMALGAAGDAYGQDKPFAGVNLRIGTTGGPWLEAQKALIVPRMVAMGATVTFVAGSPQINMAKLVAARGGPPPMDTMEVSDGTVRDIKEAGFLQAIDLAQVPNVKHLAKGQYNDLMVAIWKTQESLCYNEERYKELGLAPPKTYADLGNPKLQGRIQWPDIVSGGGLAALAGVSYANGGDLQNIKPGLEAIARLKALKFWKTGTEVLNQFKSNDIYAAAIHSGWCVRAAKAGMPVTTAHPVINSSTTGVIKQGWIAIIKGVDKKTAAAAHAYINLFIDSDFQREFAITQGVVPENVNALRDLAKDPVLARQLVLDQKSIDRMLNPDYSSVNLGDWYDQWSRTIGK